ncbi:MAG: hypothetical protein ACI9XO_001472 [Paraglaciecola sp.]|jgi:hypothetical protein
MKLSIKFFAAFALLLVLNFTATAQRGGKKMNADQMAERQTTHMVEKLNLDERQAAKVQELNLKYANKVLAAKKNNEGTREAMQPVRKAIETKKSAEMKLVLNAEQFEQYSKMQQKRGKGGKGKRGGRQK